MVLMLWLKGDKILGCCVQIREVGICFGFRTCSCLVPDGMVPDVWVRLEMSSM